jgi:tRNA nucleotidyltransferase/poly(A) polymerase
MKVAIKQILREGLITEERVKFNLPIPEDIQAIKDIFKKNGYKLYVVGGAVRDAVLGKTPKDYDLATDALPDKVEEMMKGGGLKTLPTGKAFGVINVFTDSDEYEIATFRKDLSGGRRPDAVEFTNIEGDVQRRDLTINALFYDIDTFEIVDLVGGLQDLKNGVVKTVGSAEERFGEDRLRILRAIRFAGRFGSELDPEIDAALKKDSRLGGFPVTKDTDTTSSSSNISGERIRDEFLKGIKSAKSVKHFLEMIDSYGLFKWIFGDLNVDMSFINRFKKVDPDYIVLIARLLKNNSIDVLNKKLNGLKYPADEVKAITFLVALLSLDTDTAVALKRMQKHAGVTSDQIRNFGANEGISSQLLDAFEEFELTLSGPEVMEKTGLKPGPELGKAIQKMETANFEKLLGIN